MTDKTAEPVAWVDYGSGDTIVWYGKRLPAETDLYAHPPVAEPVVNDGVLLDAIKEQLDEFRQDEDWLLTGGASAPDLMPELEIIHIDTALAIAKIGMRYAHPPVAEPLPDVRALKEAGFTRPPTLREMQAAGDREEDVREFVESELDLRGDFADIAVQAIQQYLEARKR